MWTDGGFQQKWKKKILSQMKKILELKVQAVSEMNSFTYTAEENNQWT